MSLSVIAVTFGLVFVAELPDKTMIAGIVMASRYRALAVWVGTATGMVVNAAVSVALGRLLALAPRRAVDTVVAVLLTAGAVWLFFGRESGAEHSGERFAGRLHSDRRVALTAFGVVLVAEIGDITQILTANLAAHFRQPFAVFTGAAVALVVVATIGVVAGRNLVRVMPLGAIRKAAGVLLEAFAVYSAVKAATG